MQSGYHENSVLDVVPVVQFVVAYCFFFLFMYDLQLDIWVA